MTSTELVNLVRIGKLKFQVLPHTLGLPTATWRVLATCHQRRNLAEYEGALDVDKRLMTDLMNAAQVLASAVRALPPPPRD